MLLGSLRGVHVGDRIVGDIPILVPGVGNQGGDVPASVRAGTTASGNGLLMSSSREILYASSGDDFAEAARAAAERTIATINGVTV